MSGWPSGVTHRYFLHPDSIRSFRTAIPACNKPCKKFLTLVSKILTSGFVLDLGAQEEFDNNFCILAIFCKHSIDFGETILFLKFFTSGSMKTDVTNFETDVTNLLQNLLQRLQWHSLSK